MQLHGVGVNILGCGIFISGDSNSGKSELALELVSRGHKLIADDMVSISFNNNQLFIKNPLEYFIIHIRDLGFIDIEKIYSRASTMNSSKLDFVIRLSRIIDPDPLKQRINEILFLQHPIKEYTLSLTNNRPLAVLCEVLVKYHRQLQNGIDSHQEFLNRHTQLLEGMHACNLY